MAQNKDTDENGRTVAQNRRARFDYFIDETLEAGIVLAGTEVKSLRSGRASINEAYAAEQSGELFLLNAFIPEYLQAGRWLQHETKRPRKLLVKRRELAKLLSAIRRDGVTIFDAKDNIVERRDPILPCAPCHRPSTSAASPRSA